MRSMMERPIFVSALAVFIINSLGLRLLVSQAVCDSCAFRTRAAMER